MGFISELRYRGTWFARLLKPFLALFCFLLLAIVAISWFLVYKALLPPKIGADVNFTLLLGHPSPVSFTLPNGKTREGWFFPGLRHAPIVVICHGYQSQRNELLTLATSLQEHQFNVFLFDFSGQGASPGWTTLGYRETGELLAAINALALRDDIDPNRFGLWGTNLGGYVAIAAAENTPRIRAFVVESVYESPVQMMRLQVDRSGLSTLPLVERLCIAEFKLVNFRYRGEPVLPQHLDRLAGVSKLFILSNESPVLASSTLQLFVHSPEPREQAVMPKASYTEMTDDEKHNYENAIVSFFLRALPPSVAPVRH